MEINKLYKTKQKVCTSNNYLFPLNSYEKDKVVFLIERESINTFKFLTKNGIETMFFGITNDLDKWFEEMV